MATAVRHRQLTAADLASIVTEREGDRVELIDGVAYVTPAPRPSHQFIAQNLNRLLDRHIQAGKLGRLAAAPLDVRLSDHDVVQPDLIFIARERLAIIGDVAIEGAPDLVVEVLSPGTRERDLGAKRDLYARAGVREYWLVDPPARTIEILSLEGGAYVPVPPDAAGLAQSALLPGLTFDAEAVFDLA
jgi:Uma2 family endonuclease